ncbi:DNA repair protein XRCC2 like [Apostasia shenzhenica]|uniref:DNA repair protein XRCC2 like n=1 Tax=Apostasia shenzhenica TaxID=1088818 RepID=A0A2I0ACW5_9ASPA|nr:DNA repair protein XRCC2 like [Apostasia shenzhenica]
MTVTISEGATCSYGNKCIVVNETCYTRGAILVTIGGGRTYGIGGRTMFPATVEGSERLAVSHSSPIYGTKAMVFLTNRSCYMTMHFQFLEASEQIGVSIHILMIDSIGAFYWMNRAYLSLPTDDKTRKEISLENLSKTVVEEINNIRNVQPLLVLATKVAIFGVADPKIDVQSAGVIKDYHGNLLKAADTKLYTHSFSTAKAMGALVAIIAAQEWADTTNRIWVVVKGHSEGSGNVEDRKITGNLLYREYMPLVWQSFVTHKVHLGISDVVASDERNGASPTYICKWIQPPVNMFDRYVVTNLIVLFFPLIGWHLYGFLKSARTVFTYWIVLKDFIHAANEVYDLIYLPTKASIHQPQD